MKKTTLIGISRRFLFPNFYLLLALSTNSANGIVRWHLTRAFERGASRGDSRSDGLHLCQISFNYFPYGG